MNHTTHDLRVTDYDIQATFLSLQATVEELVREHSYVTVYDEYTPQSFVENGKKLVDKIVAIIKRVFDWVVGLFSNRRNSLKKTKQELDSSIKAAKEVKTPPPPQKTDVEKYIELLQKWGYAIDGKWVPIRLFNECIGVMGDLQSQINKNREYLAKYSKLLSDADSQAVDFDPTDHHFDKLQKKFTDFYAILIPLNKSGEGGRYELHPPMVARRRDLSKHAFNENTIHALPDREFVLEAAVCATTTMANMLEGLVRYENTCKQNLDDFRQLVKKREQSHRITPELERACNFTIRTIRATLQNLGIVIDVINDTSKLTTALLKLMTHESSDGESTMDHQSYHSQHWSTLPVTSSDDTTMSSDFEAQDLEQTFLSLQQSLDDAIANQDYQTIYGDYTPQSLVQKGRELGKKFWDWLCAIFQKFWNFITGKSKRVEKARDELKKTIDEAQKRHADTGPKPQDSGSSVAHQQDSGGPAPKKPGEDPHYKKQLNILKTRGYLVDGHVDFSKNIDIAFNVLKTMHDSTNEVVEALTKMDFTKTSSTDEFLSSAGVDAAFVEKQYARWPKKITDFYHLEDDTDAYARGMGDLGVGGSINKRYGYNVRPYLTLEITRERAFDDYPLGKFLASFDFSNAMQLVDKSGRVLALLRDLETRINKTTKTLTGTRRRMLDAGRFDKEAATRIVNLVDYVRYLAKDPLMIAVEVCEDTLIAAKETFDHISAIAFNSLGSGANNSHPDHQSFPRSNTMYTLADAIQAQVTQLAFEEAGIDPNTPLYDIEQADEALANSTIEDRADIEEAQLHRQAIEEAHNQVEDAVCEAERTSDALVTMESLSQKLLEAAHSHQAISAVSLEFANKTLASALSRINLPRSLASDAIPDMQGFDASQSHATMLSVLSSVADTLFSSWQRALIAIRKKVGSQTRLLANLTKRHSKLTTELQNFKGTEQTGDILSATEENIGLAEALYVGPSSNRTEEIFTRLMELQRLIDRFAQNAVPKMDGLAQHLLNVHPDPDGNIDGSFTKVLSDMFRDIPGSTVKDPHTGAYKVVTPKFVGGYRFEVMVPPVVKKLSAHEFVELSKNFGFEHSMDDDLPMAKKEDWHNFVLRGMDDKEVRKALDLVGKAITDVGHLDKIFAHQADVGHQLLDNVKKVLGSNQENTTAPRDFVRSIMRTWYNVVSGLGFLIGSLMDACSDLLTFVGKSMSKWEFFKSRGVGDVVSEVGRHIKSDLIAAAIPAAVGAALPIGSMSRLGSAQYMRDVTRPYRRLGSLVNVGMGAHRLYRRYSWDKHARAMGHGNQGN